MAIELVEAAPAATTPTAADPSIQAEAARAAAVSPTTWRDGIAEDLRTHPSLADFKDIGSLAKSYIETKAMVGKRTDGLVKIPGEQATAEEVAAWRKAIGVPDKPDGYTVRLPEGVSVHEETLNAFRQKAHELGITPKQAEALVQFDIERYQSSQRRSHETSAAAKTEAEKALRSEWGPQFDTRLALTQRFVEQYGGEGMIDELEVNGKANSPKLIRLLEKIATEYHERGLVRGESTAKRTEEIQARLAQIQADKDFRNNFENPARHDLLVKERYALLTDLARREGMKPAV
jgi:hypothetical protein